MAGCQHIGRRIGQVTGEKHPFQHRQFCLNLSLLFQRICPHHLHIKGRWCRIAFLVQIVIIAQRQAFDQIADPLELAERDDEALRDAGLGERHAAVAGLSLGGIAVDFSHAHRTGHQASRIRQRHNFTAAQVLKRFGL